MINQKINYPYLPEGRTILYVPENNEFMLAAKEVARTQALDKSMPVGSLLVKGGVIIGRGGNGSDFHKTHVCERVKQGIPTGQGYELCEGCHPKNHSEARAIKDTLDRGNETSGADVYTWGHWWCCESCWNAMIAAGVLNVYLMEGSERLFNREHPENIVGKQFV